MKIVITSQGASLSDPLDPRFGRARRFLVVDTDTRAVEPRDNAVNLAAAQGAGIQAARQVSEIGAQAVITGHVGPKAFAVLAAAGIPVFRSEDGTAAKALDRFQRHELPRHESAHVEGHGS